VTDHVRKVLSDYFWENKEKITKALEYGDMGTYAIYVEINCEIKDALAKLGTNVFPEPDAQASQPVSSAEPSHDDSTQDPVSS
jgi:hypothetical protein